jgi:hypothetical protein
MNKKAIEPATQVPEPENRNGARDLRQIPYAFENMALTLDFMNQQLEELSEILRTYNIIQFREKASQLDCICSLIEKVIPDSSRNLLLQAIAETGYEKIQKAFITLNQVCEDINQEREDLFAILKRHRLNYPVPEDDNMKLYRFGQFLNVTLIHYHMQKKKGFKLTDLQQKIKWESALTLKPLLDRLILVFRMEIPAEARRN